VSFQKTPTLQLLTGIFELLLFVLQYHLLRWCALSGPANEVIDELRSADREMFQRVPLTVGELDKVCDGSFDFSSFTNAPFPFLMDSSHTISNPPSFPDYVGYNLNVLCQVRKRSPKLKI
jgi:hypothetical protein